MFVNLHFCAFFSMKGPMKMSAFVVLVCMLLACTTSEAKAQHFNQPSGPSPHVIQINDTNWRQTLTKEWLIQFHAPWCPACRSLVPAWNEFAADSKELSVSVAQVDVTTSPSLSGRFFVTALPTIFHVKDGVFRQYRGQRDPASLRTMIKERKWDALEPVSAWKYPDSIQMTVIAHFFSLSHYLKELNDHMQVTYDFPPWLSYVLFAIGTIFLGAVIGLMFVCLVDLIVPPRRLSRRKTFAEIQRDPLFEDYPNEDFELEEPDSDSSSDAAEKYSGTDEDEEVGEETTVDAAAAGDKKEEEEEVTKASDADTPKLTKKQQQQQKNKKQQSAKDSPRNGPDLRKRNRARRE